MADDLIAALEWAADAAHLLAVIRSSDRVPQHEAQMRSHIAALRDLTSEEWWAERGPLFRDTDCARFVRERLERKP